MGEDGKRNGWQRLVEDQLPEVIGAFVVGIVILGIPTVCWKTLRWNWQRAKGSRFRKTLFAMPSVIGVMWIAVAALFVTMAAEKKYELDMGVRATTTKLAETLPTQMGNFVEWLQSTAIAIPWWLIILLVCFPLLFAVMNQRVLMWIKWSLGFFTRKSQENPDREAKAPSDTKSDGSPVPDDSPEAAGDAKTEAATAPSPEQSVSFHGVQWTRSPGGSWVPFCPRCDAQMAVVTTPRRGMAFAGPGIRTAHLQCSHQGCQQPNHPLNMPINAVQRAVSKHFDKQGDH